MTDTFLMQISFWQRETKQTSDTDLKKKYIKSRLSLMEEDKKSVLLYVAFNLALVSLVLSEKVFAKVATCKALVVAGLLFLMSSAFLLFDYCRNTHLATFPLAKTILTLDVTRAEE